MASTIEKTGNDIFLELEAVMIFLNALGYNTVNLTLDELFSIKRNLLISIDEKTNLAKKD